jgi:hypothetical protein
MEELNHCSECDVKLTEKDKEHNRDCGVDNEEWMCINCDYASDPT